MSSSLTPSSILVYGITVITLDFDSSNRGSIPRRPTNLFLDVEEPGLSRWPWTLEHAGSNPAIQTKRLLLIHRSPLKTHRRIELDLPFRL